MSSRRKPGSCGLNQKDSGFRRDDNKLEEVARRYDVGVSALMQGQIRAANDPVGRQFIPSAAELDVQPDEMPDPIGDDAHSPVKGIVHRYADRVLFKVTNICAVYCRYCFRREKIGVGSDHLRRREVDAALDYIRGAPEIWEVILTGGDPFILSAGKFERIISDLEDISHVKSIRIHSRIPVADPDKITDTHISVLKNCSRAVSVVVHVNHKDEMTDAARMVLDDLHAAGCSLLSQSVLLRGVNDNAQALEDLFKALVQSGVRPYYLHHPDRAPGTSHFRVSLEEGMRVMRDLQGRVSGICLPRYMLDIPGGHGKIPVSADYVRRVSEGVYELTDPNGGVHRYVE